MKKVLFDTNIILDIALKRNPFFELASQLFSLIDRKIIEGYITASTVTDIYYISKKEKGERLTVWNFWRSVRSATQQDGWATRGLNPTKYLTNPEMNSTAENRFPRNTIAGTT